MNLELEEAPEEPHLHSEPSLMSPASPKPIHFPAPADIPVLNNMMDVNFNQTELHMQDPAMRNTEVREGAWKETDTEQTAAGTDPALAAPEEPTNDLNEQHVSANIPLTQNSHDPSSLATETAHLNVQDERNVPSTEQAATAIASEVAADDNSMHAPIIATPSMSVDGGTAKSPTPAQAPSSSLPSNVDVQSLLASLQGASNSATPQSHAALPPYQHDHNAITESAAPPTEHPVLSAALPNDSTEPIDQPQRTTANQPGNDLVSALAHGFAQPSSIPVELAASSASPAWPQAAAHDAAQPRAPSSQRERKIAAGEPITEDDMPWTADIQLKYDAFIQEERKYVNEGKWDQFPYGSRLFVGNLSSESVTKRDIFHVFHVYGDLAQISIKQAYGFVQFLHASDCARALSTEQGRRIKDKSIHLEVSKPQKSRNQQNNRQRSRSPVNRGSNRRGPRSPSPRGGYRDRYDDRPRNRSRSPSGYGRSRYARSPSPRAGNMDDDLPLARRAPQDVPEVQIVAREGLSRDFIGWVEQAFLTRGLRVAVLVLNPRLNEDAVLKRQLIEGVLAIVRLDRRSQDIGKLNVRLFDRSSASGNVMFNDYDDLDPPTAAELVVRSKPAAPGPPQYTTNYGSPIGYVQAPPAQQQYGYGPPPPMPPPPFGLPPGYPPQFSTQQHQQPGRPAGQPQQQDMASLHNLLASARNGGQYQQQVQAPYQQQQPAVQIQSHPYGYGAPQPPPSAVPQNPSMQAGYNAWLQQQQRAGSGAPPPVAAPPMPGQPPVNMQDILARLGSFKQ